MQERNLNKKKGYYRLLTKNTKNVWRKKSETRHFYAIFGKACARIDERVICQEKPNAGKRNEQEKAESEFDQDLITVAEFSWTAKSLVDLKITQSEKMWEKYHQNVNNVRKYEKLSEKKMRKSKWIQEAQHKHVENMYVKEVDC